MGLARVGVWLREYISSYVSAGVASRTLSSAHGPRWLLLRFLFLGSKLLRTLKVGTLRPRFQCFGKHESTLKQGQESAGPVHALASLTLK